MTDVVLPPTIKRGGKIRFAWFALHLAIHLAAWVVVVASVLVIGRFERVYKEFDLNLPAATILAIIVGQNLARWWWLYTLYFIVADSGILFCLHQLPDSYRRVRWAWVAVVPLVVVLYLVWLASALFDPLARLSADLNV